MTTTTEHDPVHYPSHYRHLPNGIEMSDVAQFFSFNIGNVIKYCWRCGRKDSESELKDLYNAKYYLEREIARYEQRFNKKA